ncbi:MAG: hypothetical protein WB611_14100 [Stellaceae bacterium]
MAWEIWHGRGNSEPLAIWNRNPVGLTVDKRITEQEALNRSFSLIRQGIGVHSVWEEGADKPKYHAEILTALGNRE